MNLNLKAIAASHTNTEEQDWEFFDGPDSGCGVDYWLRHNTLPIEFYSNCDQGEWSHEVARDDRKDEED